MLKDFVANILKKTLLKSYTTQTIEKKGKLRFKSFRTRADRTPSRTMYRFWEQRAIQYHNAGDTHYKLLSYNILAQDLLIEHLYLYMDTNPNLLRWEHRLHCLKEEVQYLNPDILCLQEMQFNHLKGFVRQIRGNRKLEYIFKKKTGHRTDGCAIIYDKSKFKLLEERAVEYHQPGSNQLLNRENIALMAKFISKSNSRRRDFVVATTHLLYNPKRCDVRMAQVEMLLNEINKFAVNNSGSGNGMPLPILLTGDFNFEPHSPPFQLLTTVTGDLQQETNAAVTNNDGTNGDCQAPDEDDGDYLKLRALNFGKMSASTYQNRWVIVDYILHSVGKNRQRIKIWSVFKLPPIHDCQQSGRIPNKFIGSDHHSLAISFSV